MLKKINDWLDWHRRFIKERRAHKQTQKEMRKEIAKRNGTIKWYRKSLQRAQSQCHQCPGEVQYECGQNTLV